MSSTIKLKGWIDTGTGRQAETTVDATVANGVIVAPGGGEAVIVVNNTGVDMARDALVYVSGVAGGVLEVSLADADVADAPAMFYLPAALLAGATGLAYKSGLSAATLNTLAAGAVDDPVYLSAATPGGWELTAPTGADDAVQVVGRVAVDSATVGQIMWALSEHRDVGTNELQDLAVTAAKIGANAVIGSKIPAVALGYDTVAAVAVDHAAGSPFEILVADANNARLALVTVVATEAAAGGPDIDIGVTNTINSVVDDFMAGAWVVGDRAQRLIHIPAAENVRATIAAAGTAGALAVYVQVLTPVVQRANIAADAIDGTKVADDAIGAEHITEAAMGVTTAVTIVLDHADASPVQLLAADAVYDRLVTVVGRATEAAAGGPDIDIGGVTTINGIIDDVGAGVWGLGYRFAGSMILPATQALRATIAAAGTAGAFNLWIHDARVPTITWLNALRAYVADGMLSIATLVISAAPATSFKTTTTTIFRIAGLPYSKIAEDPIAFSAANTINVGAAVGSYWGIWLVEVGIDGTVHTKPGGGLVDQVYANEAAAIAVLPAVTAAHIQLGYITVQCNADVAFTCNTSNLTVAGGAGNCQARTFYNLPAPGTVPAVLT